MRCASQVVGCCVCLLYEDINEFVWFLILIKKK
jgi:hypothetical protein